MSLVRVDVTSKVKGKYENGHMNLYMGDAQVGKVIETNEGFQHEMAEGFEFDKDKIFRYEQENPNEVKSYVEGCDEGWC
ncbi:YusG family protein [Halalkalibacter alkaliphilus]|uniref:YusG family protein n=1 Tax=Halalkalibacter alkaliphilus TaxID=2917993 RepID=A0A9X2CVZ5_9BACI|nr:YusG family protein [Halalkalibacter alkaliphilus]MCL7749042.1 YusG family protein [Halalkalibacter alkaliphilus]